MIIFPLAALYLIFKKLNEEERYEIQNLLQSAYMQGAEFGFLNGFIQGYEQAKLESYSQAINPILN